MEFTVFRVTHSPVSMDTSECVFYPPSIGGYAFLVDVDEDTYTAEVVEGVDPTGINLHLRPLTSEEISRWQAESSPAVVEGNWFDHVAVPA